MKTSKKVVAVKNELNLERALIASTDVKQLKAQKANVKKTLTAFDKAAGATQSACQMLFENVAHCMIAEDSEKAYKLARKNWFSLAGFKNAETLKNEKGIKLAPYWSILAWGAKESIAFYSFNELRTAYNSQPKNKVAATPQKTSSANSERAEDVETDTLAPNAHPMIVELFNKISQLPQEHQMVLAKELTEDTVKIVLRLQGAIKDNSRRDLKVA